MLMAVGPVYKPSNAVCPFCTVHATSAQVWHAVHRVGMLSCMRSHLEAEPVDALQRLLLAADAQVEACQPAGPSRYKSGWVPGCTDLLLTVSD